MTPQRNSSGKRSGSPPSTQLYAKGPHFQVVENGRDPGFGPLPSAAEPFLVGRGFQETERDLTSALDSRGLSLVAASCCRAGSYATGGRWERGFESRFRS